MKKGRKWTQAEKDRMRAVMLAKHGKKLVPVVDVLARKKRDVRSTDAGVSPYTFRAEVGAGGAGGISGGGGGSANASSYVSANQLLAIDVVRLIGHDVPADVIVKVVERILRP